MTIKKEIVERVKDLTQKGYTQEEIDELTGVSPRTQREWKRRGYPFAQPELTIPSKTMPISRGPIATAADLVQAGFIPDKVHLILRAQQLAAQQDNFRLASFLNEFISIGKRWSGMPPVWRALTAGFPIVAKDIGAPSLIDLADQVKELHPYISKELRRTYHRRVRPILLNVLAEVQAFLQDAAMAGGLPLVISGGPPTDWKDLLPWNLEGSKEWRIDESLANGRWTYMLPSDVAEKKIDIKRTWAGILYDMISRLPDPDKQKGKLIVKRDLLTLMYIWCSTAPQDFAPPLNGISRTTVSPDDHTFSGVYKSIAQHAKESDEG